MPQQPRFDRETKVLIGVWVAFMLFFGLSFACQILIQVLVLMAQ